MRASRLVATLGGVGLLPRAPGTWGSLAAIPVGYLLHGLGGFPLFFAATVIVFAVGVWAAMAEQTATGSHDASEIIVDEVAGQWIALWPLSYGLWHAGMDPWVFPYPGWIGAFILFRLFDIWKPWPVSWADKKVGGFWVMLDDVFAGVIAALGVSLAAAIAHGVLGL
ncbi:MAG: phosphatidylglycerophosphatase A [Pseudomonadota bacterium]